MEGTELTAAWLVDGGDDSAAGLEEDMVEGGGEEDKDREMKNCQPSILYIGCIFMWHRRKEVWHVSLCGVGEGGEGWRGGRAKRSEGNEYRATRNEKRGREREGERACV